MSAIHPICGRSGLFVALQALMPFVTFLCLNRECGNRPGLQPPKRNRLAGFQTITVGAVLQPLQGRIDLGDQFALSITGAQFNCPSSLG